jgi:hypothetical protein
VGTAVTVTGDFYWHMITMFLAPALENREQISKGTFGSYNMVPPGTLHGNQCFASENCSMVS